MSAIFTCVVMARVEEEVFGQGEYLVMDGLVQRLRRP